MGIGETGAMSATRVASGRVEDVRTVVDLRSRGVSRVLVHDFAGHPFQIDLSRALARRGHVVQHVYCRSYTSGKGRFDVDEGTDLRVVPVDVGESFDRYSPVRRVRQEAAYGRRFVQIALVVSGLVTVIALPMIYLRGSQPAVKALLLQNYGANLALIIAAVALVTLVLYAIRVARDRHDHEAGVSGTGSSG